MERMEGHDIPYQEQNRTVPSQFALVEIQGETKERKKSNLDFISLYYSPFGMYMEKLFANFRSYFSSVSL